MFYTICYAQQVQVSKRDRIDFWSVLEFLITLFYLKNMTLVSKNKGLRVENHLLTDPKGNDKYV